MSGTLENERNVSITEADHLQEWFLSAATRGETVISLAAFGSLLSYNITVWHPLINVKCEKWGTQKAIFGLL